VVGANAQNPTSVVRVQEVKQGHSGVTTPKGQVNTASLPEFQGNNGTANKGTVAGSRWYNYVEHLAIQNAGISNNANFPYMWDKPNMYGIYVDAASNPVRDTILLLSYGSILHPYWSEYNDVAAYPGGWGIPSTAQYKVDSIAIFGVYGRNTQKPNVIDTLRVAVTYGNGGTTNIPIYYFTGMQSNYGVDTLRTGVLIHDSLRNVAAKSTTGAAVYYRDILLNQNSLNDTDANGTNRYAFAVPNMNVPAGNLVGVSVTFKSGDTYVPFADTAFRGTTINPTNPYKYGMFRPLIYEENDGQFSSYAPGNYNSGQFKTWPSGTYSGLFVPHWAFSNAVSNYEFPYISIKLSSNDGFNLNNPPPTGVKNTVNFASVSAYPNPANNTLTIPVTMKAEGNITVSITNMVGQVVKSQDLGKAAANQTKTATFSTSDLANGVYMYVVESNGQRMTDRVVVAH
jgi:hypothetical protein